MVYLGPQTPQQSIRQSAASIVVDGTVLPSSNRTGKKQKPSDITKANRTLKAFKNDPAIHDLLQWAKPIFHILLLDDPWGSGIGRHNELAHEALLTVIEELKTQMPDQEYNVTDDMIGTVCILFLNLIRKLILIISYHLTYSSFVMLSLDLGTISRPPHIQP